jgi:hypothetical protein
MTFTAILRASACVSLVCTATPAFACSSCGCNLTSDWLSQGLVAQPGTTVSLRYDYVPQTQLRGGNNPVDRSAIPLPPDREIEQHTYNHYATLALDHAFSPEWAINIQMPLVAHPHSTITEGEADVSRSRTHGLGDIRATARFQGFGGAGITGIQFGVKLPSGAFHQKFRTGPEAGNDVDRGLQPGSGTVDAILGAYHFGTLSGAFDYVLQAQGQAALASREGYRPGSAGTFSTGIHYTGWKGITPQAQINLRVAGKDHGANADRPNSGGTQLYLAPGATAELGPRLSAFGFVQVPLYQRVNGYQLAPKVTLSLGLQVKL